MISYLETVLDIAYIYKINNVICGAYHDMTKTKTASAPPAVRLLQLNLTQNS